MNFTDSPFERMMKQPPHVSRELTRGERTELRRLAAGQCANYDVEHGCLPLGCACVMLAKWWTGGYCTYFQKAILPTAPTLAASLAGGVLASRPCALCGTPFPATGKLAYCSAECAEKALRRQKRDYIRKRRTGCRNLPR